MSWLSCLSTSILNFTYLIVYLIVSGEKIKEYLYKVEENNSLYYSIMDDPKNSSIVSMDQRAIRTPLSVRRKPFSNRIKLDQNKVSLLSLSN